MGTRTTTSDPTPSPEGPAAAVREGWAWLSPTTRALLIAYALYVPAAWVWGTAPGELAFERAEVRAVTGPLASATAIHRVTDTRLVVERDAAPDALALLDTTRIEAGDPSTGLGATAPAPGHVHGAVEREDGVHLLTETDDGTRHLVTLPASGGPAQVRAVDPSTLWPLADGTPMGHGLTDFLTVEHWQTHPSGRPAPLSGSLALLRVAQGVPLPDGQWPTLPDSAPDDLMILDADNAEPRALLDTYRIDGVWPAPTIPGFLVLAVGFPELLWCDGAACRLDTIHIRADSHPLQQLDYCAAARRIAACTPTELYFYEGDPTDEAVVFLGRAPLPAPCTSLAILDQTRVLVTGAQGPHLVRFGDDAREDDDG